MRNSRGGGYSGLNPVYAADATGSFTNVTITGTVNGTAIADGKASGSITISGSDIATALNGEDISKAKVTKNDDDSTGETLQSVYGKVLSNQAKTTGISYDNSTQTTTVGIVGFNAGAVTGVKSINAGDSSANFKVTEDDNKYTFRAGNFQVTTGKENGVLNGDITFADTNRPNESDEITLAEIISTRNKTNVITNSTTSGDSGEYESTKIRDVLEVRSDSKVNVDGTLTAKSGSKIGDITIENGQLVAPLSGATDGKVRVNVTDLAADHDLVNDTEAYGNKKLKDSINTVERIANAVSAQTAGIHRIAKDFGGTDKAGTSIENTLVVYENGTVTINENAANNPVTINSKGIKVGNNSAVVSEDGFKTSGDLYVGTKTNPTEDSTESRFYVKGADGSIKAADGKFTVDADGAVSAADGKFGVDKVGNATVGGTLNVTGATTLKNTLTVTGKTTLNDELEVAKGATIKGTLSAADGKFTVNGTSGLVTFGADAGNQSTIAGKTATFGADTGNQTVIDGGEIKAKSLKVDSFDVATITATDTLKVGTDVSLNKDGTLDLGTNTLTDTQLGNINKTIKDGQAIDAKSGTIGGVAFSATGEITAVKNITAEKGAIGEVGLEGGKITAANGGNIAGVNFAAGGNVSGINELTASTIKDGAGTIITGGEVKAKTFKVDDDNYFNSNGITAKKGGTIGGAVINETTLTVGDTKLDKADGITTNKLTIGGMTLTGTALDTGTADFQVNGVTFNQGQVTAAADKGFVTGTSSFKQGSLIVSDKNKLESDTGLITEKAAVNGTLDVTGEATCSAII